MIGQLVDGKYQIVKLLGQGGMGAVYEALHTGTNRRVALKLISSGFEKNPEAVGRFQREARAAGTIDTQHIVQVFDTGTDPTQGCPFMVMEFLQGGDLSALIEQLGPISPELTLRIAAQACVGLQKAHEAQVVHRDIKPANLFLARREGGEIIVKLLDFGIAKMRSDETGATGGHGLTRTGSMLGSPLYMSPEQAKGLKSIDHRTDLWSLGAVLFEALTGRTPHHHVDTLGQLILAICSEPPGSVQELAPWVPPEVAAIVHGALRLDPNDRFQSAAAMLEAVRALLPGGSAIHESMLVPVAPNLRAQVAPKLVITSSGPIPSSKVTGGGLGNTGGLAIGAATMGGAAQTLGGATPPKRSAGALVAVGGVAMLTLAAGGYFLLGGKQPPAAQADPLPTASAAVAPSAAPAPSVEPAVEAERTVKVRVEPAGATVEVDGKATSVSDGAVEVRGRVGTKHAVRVVSGKQETTVEIALLESGPLPDRVAVEETKAPAKAGGGAALAPKTSATPAGAAPAAPVKTAAPKGVPAIDEKFE